MKKVLLVAMVSALVLLGRTLPGEAWHEHGRVFIGPGFWGPPVWVEPYPYPVYGTPPPVVVEPMPAPAYTSSLRCRRSGTSVRIREATILRFRSARWDGNRWRRRHRPGSRRS